jgi:hypothetical protein
LPIELDQAWARAVAAWSPYARLPAPTPMRGDLETAPLAQVRLQQGRIELNPLRFPQLPPRAQEALLAHEAGHLLRYPGSLLHYQRWAQIIFDVLPPALRPALNQILNVFADLLVNQSLAAQLGPALDQLYQALPPGTGRLWQLQMRIQALGWGLEASPLADVELETDARLGVRLMRRGLRHPEQVLVSFVHLCEAYVSVPPEPVTVISDLQQVWGALGDGALVGGPGDGGNQVSPADYLAWLEALQIPAAVAHWLPAYYGNLVRPWLRPFVFPAMVQGEETPESFTVWEPSDPLTALQLRESLVHSPVIVPGVTTLQHRQEMDPDGRDLSRSVPVDIYLDSSGSIPDPAVQLSPLVAAAVWWSLSARRQQMGVRVTLWSASSEGQSTAGFYDAEPALLKLLTTRLGGETRFPLEQLEARVKAMGGKLHPVVFSDEGLQPLGSDPALRQRIEQIGANCGQATLVVLARFGQIPLWLADWPASWQCLMLDSQQSLAEWMNTLQRGWSD